MRKIIYAFLSLFLCCPSVANVLIPSDAVILAVEKFVPTDKMAVVISEYTNQLKQSNGTGISAQDLWDVCGTAGWNIKSPDGKAQCESFVNELLKMASVSFYPACDKKYKGKSGYVCVDDFFTNKIYGGTQVNLAPGQTLAQEYARLKHNDSSVLCKSNFDEGILDYKLMCTSYDKNTYYEFVFDDLEESVDKTIQDSIQTAICRMYDAKPTTAGCTGGGTNVSGTTTCWSASCAADSAKCAKINQSMAKFGYITRYKNNKCEIDFNTIYKREELKTAYDIDNFVFCHGIQVTNAPNVETYLKQYVAERAGVSESSVKCDAGFKTYTGTGCARNGITDFKDDIKTCYVGDNQIDFVFDDINEKWRKTVAGGVQGMSCIVSGGTYSGKRCIGLGEQQCEVLRKSNLTECPECKAAKWDSETQSCILPSSESAQNLQRGINIAMLTGGAILGVVVTVATAGTAAAPVTAIVLTGIETVGAGIEIGSQLMINGIADDFLVKSNQCKNATCARELLKEHLQRMANYANDMTDAESNAIDAELERLASMIPDDDDMWATILVDGTRLDDNKLSFFDFDSWEPLQVWRAVGVGLQLASVITGVGKWVVGKTGRLTKSTTAIKNKLTAAVDSVERAKEGTLSPSRLAAKHEVAKVRAARATDSLDDIEATWRELHRKYAPRNQNLDDFKAMADGNLKKMQQMSKKWLSWDEAADPRLAYNQTNHAINDYIKMYPDAKYYYENNAFLTKDELTKFREEHYDLSVLMDKQEKLFDLTYNMKNFNGNYSSINRTLVSDSKDAKAAVKKVDEIAGRKELEDKIRNKEITHNEGIEIYQKRVVEPRKEYTDPVLEKMSPYVSDDIIDSVAILRGEQIQEIIEGDPKLINIKNNWYSLDDYQKIEFANYVSNGLMQKNGIRNGLPTVYNTKLPSGTFGQHLPDTNDIQIDLSQISSYEDFIEALAHEGSHAIDYINPNAGALGSQLHDASKDLYGVSYDAYRTKPTEQSSWRIGRYASVMNEHLAGYSDFDEVLLEAVKFEKIRPYNPLTKQYVKYLPQGTMTPDLLLMRDLISGKVVLEIDSSIQDADEILEVLKEAGFYMNKTDNGWTVYR